MIRNRLALINRLSAKSDALFHVTTVNMGE